MPGLYPTTRRNPNDPLDPLDALINEQVQTQVDRELGPADLPVIDLGDEEFIIPREPPMSAAPGMAPVHPSPSSPSPGQSGAADTILRPPGALPPASPNRFDEMVDRSVQEQVTREFGPAAEAASTPTTVPAPTPSRGQEQQQSEARRRMAALQAAAQPPEDTVRPVGEQTIAPVRRAADMTYQANEPLAPPPRSYNQPSEQEQAQLQRASEQDRRRRIGRGVLTGLGLLAGIAGNASGRTGLMGLGQGLMAGAVASNPNRRQQVQSEIDQRIARDRQEEERQRALQNQQFQQEQALFEREQAGALNEQRARAAEADIALTQARTGEITGEAERNASLAEFEAQARSGNLAGMRAAIRARINAIPNGQTRAAWESELAQYDQIQDPELLSGLLQRIERTDVRRGGQGPGGAGGGRSTGVYDPASGAMVRTDRRAAATPRMAPSDGGTAPRAPATSAGTAGEPAGAPEGVTPEQYVRQALESAGYDMESEAGRLALQAYVRDYNSPETATRNAARAELRGLVRQSAGVETSDPAYRQAASDAAGVLSWAEPMRTFRARLERALDRNPQAVRAALAGDVVASEALGMGDLQRQFRDILDQLGRTRSGAAISQGEWENFRAVLGAGSRIVDPQRTVNAMLDFEARAGQLIRRRMVAAGGTQYYERWQRDNAPTVRSRGGR